MDISVKKIISCLSFFLAFTCFSCFCQDLPGKKDAKTYLESIYSGFSTPTELAIIYKLRDKGDKEGALAEATKLINRIEKTSESKKKFFLLGTAFYIRGDLYGELGKSDTAIVDLKKACSYGNPEAPYQVASRLLLDLKLTGNRDPNKLRESQLYFEMGAKLGDIVCMDLVQIGLKATNEIEKLNYWSLLLRMAESVEQIKKYQTFYNHTLSDEERAYLEKAFIRYTLSPIMTSSVPHLPGRSLLCAAYTDLALRKMLGFAWRAFFSQNFQDKSFSMETVYEGFRNTFESKNPLIKVYLLINNKYQTEKSSIRLNSSQLIKTLLPGDHILVNCGPLSHYAVIWSSDTSKHLITILDPFYEFWQPTHNDCVTSIKKINYSQKRWLIQLKSNELQDMLVAVFTIRDNK